MELALEALEGMQNAIYDIGGEHVIDLKYAVEKADVAEQTITTIKEALAQPEQETNKNGSPCPEFWDWLPKAYNFEGDGNFTKYNMEVAFLAGKQASQPEQAPVAWMSKDADIVYTSIEVDGYFQHDHIPLYTIPPRKAGEK